MKKDLKIVYFGTPEIADEVLKGLIADGRNIICCVTREDKPKGRGYVMEYPPVKKTALEHGIEVYQPKTLRTEESIEYIKSLGADIFITCAYGRIFPKEVLDIPEYGCINVHASLLPFLRGASPINRAIMNGDTVGGVTIMKMDEGVDTGDIILKETIEIPDDMDFGTYYEIISALGVKAIRRFFELDEIKYEKQDESKATFAPKVEKEETLLDFARPSEEIYNKIRGLSPVPCAYTFLAGKRCKIYKALRGEAGGKAGTVLSADKNGITVACGDKSVVITELQPEGKSRMTAAAFLAGNKVM